MIGNHLGQHPLRSHPGEGVVRAICQLQTETLGTPQLACQAPYDRERDTPVGEHDVPDEQGVHEMPIN